MPTMLDIINLYAVSIAGIFAVLLIRWANRFASPYVPHVRFWTLSHLIYPLLIHRRKWMSITYIEAALLGAYVIANGVCMGLGVHGTSDLMLRSGMMASVNLIPLFLGGRTNLLANSFGIPLHTYYLAHHWIGRMVVTQGLLHAGLAISSQNWTFNASVISRFAAASALVLILLSSLYFVRGFMFETFLQAHLPLAFTTIGGLIWHMFPGEFTKFLFPIISISLWSITTLYRLYRIQCTPDAYILSYATFPQPSLTGQRHHDTVRLDVRVERHIRAEGGQYAYLYFSSLRWRYRFQGHPFTVAWYKHEEEIKDGKRINFTSLTFLIQPQSGLTARLTRELQLSNHSSKKSSSGATILYDGPYGQDLHLERYETVMLVAKGIGIAGVLPYAQFLAQRNCHDDEIKKLLKLASTPNKGHLRNSLYKDATRKVDLFWKLDHNRQEKWISDHLNTLQDQDPGRRSNLIYCYYPEEKSSKPLIKLDEGWKCIYPGDAQLTLDAVIEQEAGKSRRNIVVACGNAIFTQSIRKKVLEIMSKDNIIEFNEVEFRPQGLGTQDDAELGRLIRKRPNIQVTRTREDNEEIELVEFTTRETRNVLSKAPGMQVMGRVDKDNDHVENATRVRASAFV